MSTIVQLEVSEVISSETDVSDTYTPAAGKKVYGFAFNGSGLFTPNSYVAAIWDKGGAEESVLWSTNGSESILLSSDFTGDGAKQVAIICSNGETSSAPMSGRLTFKVEN